MKLAHFWSNVHVCFKSESFVFNNQEGEANTGRAEMVLHRFPSFQVILRTHVIKIANKHDNKSNCNSDQHSQLKPKQEQRIRATANDSNKSRAITKQSRQTTRNCKCSYTQTAYRYNMQTATSNQTQPHTTANYRGKAWLTTNLQKQPGPTATTYKQTT